MKVDLAAYMKNSRREVNVIVAQRKDLTGSQRRLPDSENRALKDQSVAVGAARAGATLESRYCSSVMI
ncbi:MAG TPA: hypothetical protein VGY30_09915 [Solirubrobacteraceae bacterium]|nr:hypothetical protein [Solirubrobacteraceae bacterium]